MCPAPGGGEEKSRGQSGPLRACPSAGPFLGRRVPGVLAWGKRGCPGRRAAAEGIVQASVLPHSQSLPTPLIRRRQRQALCGGCRQAISALSAGRCYCCTGGTIFISTRRFFWRPASVSLVATGRDSPYPITSMRWPATPRWTSRSRTALARRLERSML